MLHDIVVVIRDSFRCFLFVCMWVKCFFLAARALRGAWMHHRRVVFDGVVIGFFVFSAPGEPFTGQRYSSSLWDRKNQSCPLTRSWREVWLSRPIKTNRGGCHGCQPQVRKLEPRFFLRNPQYCVLKLCFESILFWLLKQDIRWTIKRGWGLQREVVFVKEIWKNNSHLSPPNIYYLEKKYVKNVK